MSKSDGGPAYPSPGVVIPGTYGGGTQQGAYEGMPLRDYFAAKAMQGFRSGAGTWGLATSQKIAQAAYELADAMIAAREVSK